MAHFSFYKISTHLWRGKCLWIYVVQCSVLMVRRKDCGLFSGRIEMRGETEFQTFKTNHNNSAGFEIDNYLFEL